MSVQIYGIKNCDTMKKALNWLDEHGIAYEFIDYKKHGVDESVLRAAISAHGWESVINRRGTSWRKLPEDVKNNMDENSAIGAALDNPSLIKRPLLHTQNAYHLGFKADQYTEIFK